MAENSKNILQQARERGLATPSAGMQVPEGYFDDFNARMAAMLPERPEIENAAVAEAQQRPATFWGRVRPYVYMAAMFAGVWCMLQLFASLSGTHKLQPIADNPVLAKALASDEFVMDYIYEDINTWDILDEMVEDGTLDIDYNFTPAFEPDSSGELLEGDYILPQ